MCQHLISRWRCSLGRFCGKGGLARVSGPLRGDLEMSEPSLLPVLGLFLDLSRCEQAAPCSCCHNCRLLPPPCPSPCGLHAVNHELKMNPPILQVLTTCWAFGWPQSSQEVLCAMLEFLPVSFCTLNCSWAFGLFIHMQLFMHACHSHSVVYAHSAFADLIVHAHSVAHACLIVHIQLCIFSCLCTFNGLCILPWIFS